MAKKLTRRGVRPLQTCPRRAPVCQHRFSDTLDSPQAACDTAQMSIKIDLLRVFCAVAESGSLSRAAQILGRTPSAVSMALKQLEEHLGAPLFSAARKSELTPLGRAVLKEARQEVSHYARTIRRIEGLARATHGSLRLAVTPSVAQTVLPPVIKAYNARFPNVAIELRDLDSAGVLEELMADRADIGIASLPERAGFERFALFSDPFGVVCPRGHPLASSWDSLTWADIVDEPLISNGLCEMITDPSFAVMRARSRLFVRNTGSLLALVRAGAGITVLPERALGGGLDDLVFLPLKDSAARRSVQGMHRAEDQLLPPVLHFANSLCALKLQQS